VEAALDPAAHETGAFEHLDVLGSGRERHAERRRQLADVALPGGKAAQHGAPGRIGQSVKHAVERSGLLLNHMVEHIGGASIGQPFGTISRPAGDGTLTPT
jgi:hypothetical protein